jgi:TRAP-type C4-dicarboxylate transport system permease small subunit
MSKRIHLVFKKVLDVIEIVTGILCQLLLVGVVVMGITGILTRYLPVSQPIWIGQMAIFLGVWMYFLGFVITAKREEYIFIEYFHKFIPPLIGRIIDIIFHVGMIGFCIVNVVGGWPLQILQRKLKVTSFPLPQNLFSLPVMVSMGLIALVLIYYTWMRVLSLRRFLARKNET